MKKYIYGLFMALVSVAMFTACSADEGTEPGNDSKVNVVLYQYTATTPNDPDVDTQLRIATNSATQEVYVLAEKTVDYAAHVKEMGDEAYKDYVVENGQKVDNATGAANTDYTVKNLNGENTITVVAVGNGGKSSASVNFTGYTWTTVAEGTYHFSANAAENFGESVATTLQYKDSDPSTYRFKDFWGTGKHVTFTVTENTTDYFGTTGKIIAVPAQATPYTYGSYGTINMADYVTAQLGNYPSAILPNGKVYIAMAYYVEAGTLAGGLDQFVPNK